jgi:hypothetical protein
MNEDCDTCAANKEHRDQDHYRDIRRNLMKNRTRAFDVPDAVESALYRLKERVNRPKENDQADTDEESALCSVQVPLHHRHDGRHHVRLA